jgi:glutamine cyclotransferase
MAPKTERISLTQIKSLFLCFTFLSFAVLEPFWPQCLKAEIKPPAPAVILKVKVRREIARSRPLFTQGLFFEGGTLYESSGLYSKSELNSYELSESPWLKEIQNLAFPPLFFAEGACYANGFIQVLTWQEGTLFKINPDTFAIEDSLYYQGEGWGLTFDGERLLVSDGSDTIRFRDPESFAEVAPPIKVKDGQRPVRSLNELEWDPVNGLILANIFQSDLVAAIDPISGLITHYLDLYPLRARANSLKSPIGGPRPDVTNGLALDSSGRLYATGKNWNILFEIEPDISK